MIYFLDENSIFKPKMDKIFYAILNSKIQFITSAITVEEFMVMPYRNENSAAINGFHKFIDENKIPVLKIDTRIAVQAAKIHAEYVHFKTMGAIQLSVAVCSGCDVFLTNDRQLK